MWNCTHFRHATDVQLRRVDIFLATKMICSLSTLKQITTQWITAFSTGQDLSNGQQYPSFKQMEPEIYITSCVDNKLESTLRQLPAEDTGRTIDNA